MSRKLTVVLITFFLVINAYAFTVDCKGDDDEVVKCAENKIYVLKSKLKRLQNLYLEKLGKNLRQYIGCCTPIVSTSMVFVTRNMEAFYELHVFCYGKYKWKGVDLSPEVSIYLIEKILRIDKIYDPCNDKFIRIDPPYYDPYIAEILGKVKMYKYLEEKLESAREALIVGEIKKSLRIINEVAERIEQ